ALDTSGEKECEEFIGVNEEIESVGLESLFGICSKGNSEEMAHALSSVLKEIEDAVSRASEGISKSQLIDRLRSLMSEFHHVETGAGLDSRI
ncbi:MAG: hypothetical protein IMZ62_07945, partial [Chloroflexi bacterium]|nr:hypothetical protein [Chloroflexota bacterium]